MNIDAKLLRACEKGNRKAQFQLYKTCFSWLMGVCVRYKQDEDEARAILNVGFLKILKNIDKYDTNIPFEAWTRRIMINTIIDEYRKYKKEKSLVEYTDFEVVEKYEKHVDYNEADKQFDIDDIQFFIKKLPTITQKVFNLYVIDGFSHKEIATLLEMSIGTSKWHLSNARKKLKVMLVEAMKVKRAVS